MSGVELVGATQIEFVEDGGQSIAWPSGAAAGNTGLIATATGSGRKPATYLPGGWNLLRSNSAGEAIYGKFSLTDADLAGDLPGNAVILGLAVVKGAIAFGQTTAQAAATVPTIGDAVFTFCRKSDDSPALTPPDGRLSATDAINEHFSKIRVSKKKTKWVGRRYNTFLTIPTTAGFTKLATNATSALSVVVLGSVETTPVADDITIVSPADGDVISHGTSYTLRWTSSTYYTGEGLTI